MISPRPSRIPSRSKSSIRSGKEALIDVGIAEMPDLPLLGAMNVLSNRPGIDLSILICGPDKEIPSNRTICFARLRVALGMHLESLHLHIDDMNGNGVGCQYNCLNRNRNVTNCYIAFLGGHYASL